MKTAGSVLCLPCGHQTHEAACAGFNCARPSARALNVQGAGQHLAGMSCTHMGAHGQWLRRLWGVVYLRVVLHLLRRQLRCPKATSLKHSLGMLHPAANGHPKATHQWLLMGVQACRLPALKPLKRLKRFKTLKTLKTVKTLYGRPSLPFASP